MECDRIRRFSVLTLLLASASQGFAQIIAYEPQSVFPEFATPQWTRIGTFDADRWLQDGCFFQFVQIGVWGPPPYGEFDGYRRTIGEFALLASFFVEWRVRTNVPPSDIDGGPVILSAWGDGPALYHFVITDGRVRFVRDNPNQLTMFVDIEPNLAHTHRIEIVGAFAYSWYIDGELRHSGTSIGPYPTDGSGINWSARFYLTEHTTKWDYLRYGVIPLPSSGDVDSDADFDGTDLYYFIDCLMAPDYDAAGPGCRWADLNADGAADGRDISLFAQRMLGP